MRGYKVEAIFPDGHTEGLGDFAPYEFAQKVKEQYATLREYAPALIEIKAVESRLVILRPDHLAA